MDPSSSDISPNPRRQQMEASIEGLNSRIARLAIGLGLSLQDASDVARVMSWQDVPEVLVERRNPEEAQRPMLQGSSLERRVARAWRELRALIVLRYKVETEFVEQVGTSETRQILEDIEVSLVRKGFKPGADGLDLEVLFKDLPAAPR
jgi:hypothetical protein